MVLLADLDSCLGAVAQGYEPLSHWASKGQDIVLLLWSNHLIYMMLPHDCSADSGLWLSWLLRFELISFLASLYTKNPASPKASFLNSSTAAFLLRDRYNMIQHDTTAYTLKMNALGSWKGGVRSCIVFAIFIGAQANWNWWGLFSCSSAGQLSEWRDAKSLMESWTCWTIDSSQLHATGTNVRTCKYPGHQQGTLPRRKHCSGSCTPSYLYTLIQHT